MTSPDSSLVPESTPKPTGSDGPSCAGASGSRLTTREITDGLEYIATSPAPEYGGFHPNAVRIAQGALEEIVRLRGIIARNAAVDEPPHYARERAVVASLRARGLSA